MDRERESPDNLQNGWGGFFDFVYFDTGENRFKRPDKVGYGFWTIDVGTDPPQLLPLSLIRATHVDYNLYIQHYSFQPESYQVYLAPEIHRAAEPEDLVPPADFDCLHLVSAVHIYRHGQRYSTLLTSDTAMPGEPTLLITHDVNGNPGIGWSKHLRDSLVQKALSSL